MVSFDWLRKQIRFSFNARAIRGAIRAAGLTAPENLPGYYTGSFTADAIIAAAELCSQVGH
jgi:hypothetical protein